MNYGVLVLKHCGVHALNTAISLKFVGKRQS
jgi:hypothetical protein